MKLKILIIFGKLLLHNDIFSDCSAEVKKWTTIVLLLKDINTLLKKINTTNTAVQNLISSLQTPASEILSKTQEHSNNLQLRCPTTTVENNPGAATTTATTTGAGHSHYLTQNFYFLYQIYFLACKCGVERTSRIVGGAEVKPVRFKYLLTRSGQDKIQNSF